MIALLKPPPPTQTFGDRCEEIINPKLDTTVILSDFEVISCVTTLKSKICSYVVDSVNGSVEFKDGLVQGMIDKELIGSLIEELRAVQRRLNA